MALGVTAFCTETLEVFPSRAQRKELDACETRWLREETDALPHAPPPFDTHIRMGHYGLGQLSRSFEAIGQLTQEFNAHEWFVSLWELPPADFVLTRPEAAGYKCPEPAFFSLLDEVVLAMFYSADHKSAEIMTCRPGIVEWLRDLNICQEGKGSGTRGRARRGGGGDG